MAIAGYGAVLLQARHERNDATNWSPYAEQLAFEPIRSTNVALYPQYGFADLGTNFRLPMSATWALDPIEPAELSGAFVFFTADEPLLYASSAVVRVFLCGREIGRIDARALGARTGPFVPDVARRLLEVPPEKTFGYQFLIDEANCPDRSSVTVRGTFTTWRIYRIGIVRETSRFAFSALR